MFYVVLAKSIICYTKDTHLPLDVGIISNLVLLIIPCFKQLQYFYLTEISQHRGAQRFKVLRLKLENCRFCSPWALGQV